jgi:hypothetical protein
VIAVEPWVRHCRKSDLENDHEQRGTPHLRHDVQQAGSADGIGGEFAPAGTASEDT